MRHSIDPDELERVESLLRIAAEFTPETEAESAFGPMRQMKANHRTPIVFGAVVLLLVGAAFFHSEASQYEQGSMRPSQGFPRAALKPSAHLANGVPVTPSAVHTGVRYPKAQSAILVARPRPRRLAAPFRLVQNTRREFRTHHARWRDETVQLRESGFVAAGWLVENGESEGDLVATPALLSIATGGAESIAPRGAAESTRLVLNKFSVEN